MMSESELDSDLARVTAEVLPVSAVPRTVTEHTELVSWDHERYPGLMWRIPDPSLPDTRYHYIGLIEGLRIREYEKVVILIDDKLRAVVPNGDWITKRGSGERKEDRERAQKVELIWVDLREFETSRRVVGAQAEGGRSIDATCALNFKVTDPGALVGNLVLEEGIGTWKDLDQKIHAVVEEAILTEMVKQNANDIASGSGIAVGSVRDTLTKMMSGWGMVVLNVGLDIQPEAKKQVTPTPMPKLAPPREQRSSIEAERQQIRDLMTRAILRREQQVPVSHVPMLDVEWEALPRRWVPQSKRGEVKCDGCGSDIDLYAECNMVCKAGNNKCRLCKECFSKRKICAFS